MKVRGGEIHLHVKDLLDVLVTSLRSVECQPTRQSIFNAVCLLASHQVYFSVFERTKRLVVFFKFQVKKTNMKIEFQKLIK